MAVHTERQTTVEVTDFLGGKALGVEVAGVSTKQIAEAIPEESEQEIVEKHLKELVEKSGM